MPRISQLPSLTTAAVDDELAIVDTSTATTKKVTPEDLAPAVVAGMGAGSLPGAKIEDGAVTAAKLDFGSFGLNIKSAQNNSSVSLPSGETDTDLGTSGCSVSFTVASACVAFVTVSVGLSSGGAGEFGVRILKDGSVKKEIRPSAQDAAGTRGTFGTVSWAVPLSAGTTVLSAGVITTSSPTINTGRATITALVLGEVTA